MTMETRTLGTRSGLEISSLGLGLWAVAGSEWGPGEDPASLDAIEAALDAGVTFFDTADIYGGGHSEELLGKAMTGRRERFVVATKIGWDGYDNGRSRYDTPEKLIAGVETSLRRLRTDRIEAIQCHINHLEPNTPVFVEGFRRLKDQGKVRAWGVSTSDISLLKRFNRDGDCDLLQIDYSILNRTAEAEMFPYCLENGIGVIVRGPLAMGLLADKYSESDTFPPGDFRRAWIEDPTENIQFREDLDAVRRLRSVVPDPQTMAQFALRFVRSHPAMTTVIPGARNRAQAEANCSVAELPALSAEELAQVDRLVPPGGGRRIWPA